MRANIRRRRDRAREFPRSVHCKRQCRPHSHSHWAGSSGLGGPIVVTVVVVTLLAECHPRATRSRHVSCVCALPGSAVSRLEQVRQLTARSWKSRAHELVRVSDCGRPGAPDSWPELWWPKTNKRAIQMSPNGSISLPRYLYVALTLSPLLTAYFGLMYASSIGQARQLVEICYRYRHRSPACQISIRLRASHPNVALSKVSSNSARERT